MATIYIHNFPEEMITEEKIKKIMIEFGLSHNLNLPRKSILINKKITFHVKR